MSVYCAQRTALRVTARHTRGATKRTMTTKAAKTA